MNTVAHDLSEKFLLQFHETDLKTKYNTFENFRFVSFLLS